MSTIQTKMHSGKSAEVKVYVTLVCQKPTKVVKHLNKTIKWAIQSKTTYFRPKNNIQK
jgi:hypothetical protein